MFSVLLQGRRTNWKDILVDHSDEMLENHQGDAAIPFIQVTVLTEKGKTAQEVAARTIAGAEMFSYEDIIDLTAIFEVLQFGPDFLSDGSSLA